MRLQPILCRARMGSAGAVTRVKTDIALIVLRACASRPERARRAGRRVGRLGIRDGGGGCGGERQTALFLQRPVGLLPGAGARMGANQPSDERIERGLPGFRGGEPLDETRVLSLRDELNLAVLADADAGLRPLDSPAADALPGLDEVRRSSVGVGHESRPRQARRRRPPPERRQVGPQAGVSEMNARPVEAAKRRRDDISDSPPRRPRPSTDLPP